MPAKRIIGNMEPEFIKQRKQGLHDFIQSLLTHPGLSRHPEVKSFLGLGTPDILDEMDEETESDSAEQSSTEKVNLGPSEKPHAKPSDFEFLKMIGKGSFGKVLLARHKDEDTLYAVKVLNKAHIIKRNETKHIMSERNVLLQNLQHPFLVGLHYSFQTPDKLYFVLDYVNGGELFFHLQRERQFPEPRAQFYAAEMASAIGYLHSLNIIYRDLKPENILLDSEGHVVLTDFGLCKEGIQGSQTTTTFCGTPEYLAPEVLRKQPYDRTVDWWCLGAVLYEMMFGLPPFYSRDTAEMYENILYKVLRVKPSASPAAKNLLEGLLHKDKRVRLGQKRDIDDIKEHAFFASIDWRMLIERKLHPPYNPNVSDRLDLKHFDPEFTKEPIPGSVGRSAALASSGAVGSVGAFAGFSYAPTQDDSLLNR